MSDEHSFELFMAAYQDMVFSVAMRLLGNAAEAEDISQEVFLKAHDRFAELSQSPTAGGWLRTVARNLSLNHLARHRARWTLFSDVQRDDAGADRQFDIPTGETQSREADRIDRRRLIELALRKLPDDYRVPLVLYHFEDLTYEEIAVRLNRSLAKVKTDIHRGRESLRKTLTFDSDGHLTGLRGLGTDRSDSDSGLKHGRSDPS